jgi:rare lipoprotein A
LDPSEEITPEELASIPEPFPATPPALKAAEDQPMKSGPQAPSEAPSGASQTQGAAIPEPDSGGYVWRVQIFASDQREEAERVSREAVEALDATASVDRDGALYKVRLGRFATEAEAQALRERAIRAGYPGAFRIRTAR